MTEAPVLDFDHHSGAYAERWPEIYREARERCPMARVETYGGFWLPLTYDLVAKVARDDATFSSDHDPDGTTTGYQGINIPGGGPIRSTPIEVDPPEYQGYRRMLNPFFSPAAVAGWTPFITDACTACVDRFIADGSADLVLDLLNPLPALFTMAFMGLPLDDWEAFSHPYHQYVWALPGSEEQAEAQAGVSKWFGRYVELAAERIAHPTDDFVSTLAQAAVNGSRLSPQTIGELLNLIAFGGVDTTTALTANALWWLHEHPDIRQRLTDDLSLMDLAVEEFLRYFTPVQTMARTVTHDTEFAGDQMCSGERVMLSWATANRDPSVFPDPDELQIERHPNRHTSFGLGIHRCLGSNFARVEINAMIHAVLTRLPDYRIDLDRAEKYHSIGTVNGWITLPVTFTPGPVLGSGLRL